MASHGACNPGKVSIDLVVCSLASRAIAKASHECCAARSIRESPAPSGLEAACPAWPIFRVFMAVSDITGAAVPSDEARLNRFPKAGAIVLNLRLPARKSYALNLAAVPDPGLIACGGKKPTRRLRKRSSQRPYRKHQRYPIGRPIFSRTWFPYTKRPLWTEQQDCSSCLDRNPRFIHHAQQLDRPTVGYFCPVLTADGKLDCAPK